MSTHCEVEVDALLRRICPCRAANDYRGKLVSFIRQALSSSGLGLRLQGSGSNTSRTYLPISDIDLVIQAPSSSGAGGPSQQDLQALLSVFQALCAEVASAEQRLEGSDPHALQQAQPFCIRNVEFINARTKVLHLLINNIGVDLTVNQPSAVSAAVYIDRCDALLGQNHLLKRSILLVKCWCLHESERLVSGGGANIIDSKGGFLSSYAVCVMVLYLFNTYGSSSSLEDNRGSRSRAGTGVGSDQGGEQESQQTQGQALGGPARERQPLDRPDGGAKRGAARGILQHPLTVLRAFLYVFSEKVNWATDCVSVSGIDKIAESSSGLRNGSSSGAIPFPACSPDMFQEVADAIAAAAATTTTATSATTTSASASASASSLGSGARFQVRALNIRDPLSPLNNLGHCVARKNVAVIEAALRAGHALMEGCVRAQSQSYWRNSHGQGRGDVDFGIAAVLGLGRERGRERGGETASSSSSCRVYASSSLSSFSSAAAVAVATATSRQHSSVANGQGYGGLESGVSYSSGAGNGSGKGASFPFLRCALPQSNSEYMQSTSVRCDMLYHPLQALSSACPIDGLGPAGEPGLDQEEEDGGGGDDGLLSEELAGIERSQRRVSSRPQGTRGARAMSTVSAVSSDGSAYTTPPASVTSTPDRAQDLSDEDDACKDARLVSLQEKAAALTFSASRAEDQQGDDETKEEKTRGAKRDRSIGGTESSRSILTIEVSCQTDEAPLEAPPLSLSSMSTASSPPTSNSKSVTTSPSSSSLSPSSGGENSPALRKRKTGKDGLESPVEASSSRPKSPVAQKSSPANSACVRTVCVAVLVILVGSLAVAGYIISSSRPSSESTATLSAAVHEVDSGGTGAVAPPVWLLPGQTVVLSPVNVNARLPVPKGLPVSDKIGGVKRFTYEWRWEWEFEPRKHPGIEDPTSRGQAPRDVASNESVPRYLVSAGSPYFSLPYREDREAVASSSPATTTCRGPSVGDNSTACTDTTLFLSLGSHTGTYLAFRRLYRIRHLGGEGGITMAPTGGSSSSGSRSSKSGTGTSPGLELLQSLPASSSSVIMALPPRSKTKPGYFIKKRGERLELIVSAVGLPRPSFDWFKNGFLLPREGDAEGASHVLVIEKLDKSDEGTYTCSLRNIAGTVSGGEFTVILHKE